MLVPSFLIVPPVTCRVLPESPGCGGMMSKRFLPEVRQACASAPALLWLGGIPSAAQEAKEVVRRDNRQGGSL